MNDRICTVPKCGRPHYALGWCVPHHHRHRRYGDVLADLPIGKMRGFAPSCGINGCPEPPVTDDWCGKHCDETASFKAAHVAVRKCTTCLELKPVTDFSLRQGARGRIRHSWCKECATAYNRQRYLANQEQRQEDSRAWYAEMRADPERFLRYSLGLAATKLGLDLDLVARHFESHHGACDICGGQNVKGRTRLTIDHDHATGAFRGLLCSTCNTAIGLLRDNPKLAIAAAGYLRSYGR